MLWLFVFMSGNPYKEIHNIEKEIARKQKVYAEVLRDFETDDFNVGFIFNVAKDALELYMKKYTHSAEMQIKALKQDLVSMPTQTSDALARDHRSDIKTRFMRRAAIMKRLANKNATTNEKSAPLEVEDWGGFDEFDPETNTFYNNQEFKVSNPSNLLTKVSNLSKLDDSEYDYDYDYDYKHDYKYDYRYHYNVDKSAGAASQE